MSEQERYIPQDAKDFISPEQSETHTPGQERIEGDIWRPGIFDEYADEVGAAASTKALRRTEEVALRILGDQKRFERPMKERIRAGRILAELRNDLNPEIDLHNIVKSQLAHSGEVKKIDQEFVQDLVKGNLDQKQILKTDGLITDLKDYPLYISAADCYPIGVYDPENKAIGAFHNGFWGLLNKISENGVAAMSKEYGSKPENLKVSIAPGISAEGYKVDQNMVQMLRDKFGAVADEWVKPVAEAEGQYHLDLKTAIIQRLVDSGVRPENIEATQYSTDQNNDLFPSERLEGNAGRDSYGFMIALK